MKTFLLKIDLYGHKNCISSKKLSSVRHFPVFVNPSPPDRPAIALVQQNSALTLDLFR